MFSGSMVALVTPFKDGKVDERALRDLVEWHISEGTDVIVPCGTTGESATLSHEEHSRVIEVVIDQVRKRIPVLAGTGSNATTEAVRMSRHAESAGAAGVLLISPYYNKPPQQGLYLHFKAVAESVKIPVVLYNVPGRTSVNVLPETVARCAGIKNVVGIKEACGNLAQIKTLAGLCEKDFTILSGEDAQNFEILELGGKGFISVTANVIPGKLAQFWDLYAAGKKAEAQKIHQELMPLHDAMFYETNPIPVKTALGLMGKCSDEMRLPLCAMGQQNKQKLTAVLKQFGLI